VGHREAKRLKGVIVARTKTNVGRLHHAMCRFGSREILLASLDTA